MRLALVQATNATCSADDGFALSLQAIGDAFEAGADLVVLPELIVGGYRLDRKHQGAIAEMRDGRTITAWTELAAGAGGYVVGGFAERDGDAVYNTAVLVGPGGVCLHYRKLHLFRGERDVFAAGDLGLPVVATPLGRIGLCICYDLRFVETLRILALKGAELVCVPTAWVPGFDAQWWDDDGFCPQARAALVQANLNQVFVACASQVGTVGDLTFLGSSILAGPDGACLAGPLATDAPETVIVDAELHAAEVALARADDIRPRAERRRDVYALMTEGVAL
jgi:N-carbamoylputrescine amidase